jgi:hypothetical protein
MYNPGIDMNYDLLGFGVASERVSAKDKTLHYSVQAGRVVAYASTDFISNNRLSNDGNFALVLSTINWLVGGGTQLDVPARPIQKFQLNLNQQELLRLRYSLLLILPSAAAVPTPLKPISTTLSHAYQSHADPPFAERRPVLLYLPVPTL